MSKLIDVDDISLVPCLSPGSGRLTHAIRNFSRYGVENKLPEPTVRDGHWTHEEWLDYYISPKYLDRVERARRNPKRLAP